MYKIIYARTRFFARMGRSEILNELIIVCVMNSIINIVLTIDYLHNSWLMKRA